MLRLVHGHVNRTCDAGMCSRTDEGSDVEMKVRGTSPPRPIKRLELTFPPQRSEPSAPSSAAVLLPICPSPYFLRQLVGRQPACAQLCNEIQNPPAAFFRAAHRCVTGTVCLLEPGHDEVR